MGRIKLKIKRLESSGNRQITYSKRRNGILKKAKELSILCDIDIALLMFSPTGRPTMLHGECSNFEEVITKFARLTPQERTKRKLESLETLKKTFKKLDHDVNIQDFMSSRSRTMEELTGQVTLLQAQLTELHRRLSCWSSQDNINDVDRLRQMEGSLRESIDQIHIYKENLGKRHIISLACASQFQGEMSLPWIPNNENQPLISVEPTFLQQGDVQCVTDVSLPGCSGQQECELVELSTSVGLSIEDFGEQYASYPFVAGLSEDNRKFKPGVGTNLQWSSVDTTVFNNNFTQHTWVPGIGPCGLSLYNDNDNARQQQLK